MHGNKISISASSRLAPSKHVLPNTKLSLSFWFFYPYQSYGSVDPSCHEIDPPCHLPFFFIFVPFFLFAFFHCPRFLMNLQFVFHRFFSWFLLDLQVLTWGSLVFILFYFVSNFFFLVLSNKRLAPCKLASVRSSV